MDALTEDKKVWDKAVTQLNQDIAKAFYDAVGQVDHTKGVPNEPTAEEILANTELRELTHEQLYEYAVVQTGVAVRAVREYTHLVMSVAGRAAR